MTRKHVPCQHTKCYRWPVSLPPAPPYASSRVLPGTAECPDPRNGGEWRRWQRGRPELWPLPAAKKASEPSRSGQQHTEPGGFEIRLPGQPFSRKWFTMFIFRVNSCANARKGKSFAAPYRTLLKLHDFMKKGFLRDLAEVRPFISPQRNFCWDTKLSILSKIRNDADSYFSFWNYLTIKTNSWK